MWNYIISNGFSVDYRLMHIPELPSVANMTTAAYLSGGIGINYYATSATMLGSGAGTNPATSSMAYNQQQQQTHYPYLGTLPYQQQQQPPPPAPNIPADPSLRRRLFAGFRPMSGFGRSRSRSSQHRSISLPESNYILSFSILFRLPNTTATTVTFRNCIEISYIGVVGITTRNSLSVRLLSR